MRATAAAALAPLALVASSLVGAQPVPPPSMDGGFAHDASLPPADASPMDRARACIASGRSQAEVNRCIVAVLNDPRRASCVEVRLLLVTARQSGDRDAYQSALREYRSRCAPHTDAGPMPWEDFPEPIPHRAPGHS